LRLTEISARGFRNLAPEPVFFGSGITLVAGENAQGKTNLLEAVAIACGQRSFRRAGPAEMAADGGSFAVSAAFACGPRQERIEVAWSRGAGRRFTRSGKPISFREASALAPAVFFAPEHRDLVVGSPGLRRRFLDRLALHCRPAAGDDLARYERALASRNALLAQGGVSDQRGEELEAWTEEVLAAAWEVRRHRQEALSAWREVFGELAGQAGPEYGRIQAVYQMEETTPEELRQALRRLAPIERRRGHTLRGPHRDDLAWSRDGRPLAGQASAGEIHRIVGLIKFAEWATVATTTEEKPLLAIDEFDAGLSEGWVEALVAALPNAETVLLTSASEPARHARWVNQVLEIRSGRAVARPRAVNL
jgi:DNA replication and repair protein RecF